MVLPTATDDAALMLDLWDECIRTKINVQEGSAIHKLIGHTRASLRQNDLPQPQPPGSQAPTKPRDIRGI
jgi:hypothetical protein